MDKSLTRSIINLVDAALLHMARKELAHIRRLQALVGCGGQFEDMLPGMLNRAKRRLRDCVRELDGRLTESELAELRV